MSTTTQNSEKPAPPVALHVDLRDYFAAKAMQALISGESHGEWEDEHAARSAYRMADAMLKARQA